MNLSEDEYKKTILAMIGFAFLIFVIFTGLILFVYRDTILNGEPPKQKSNQDYGYNQGYNYNQYQDYHTPNQSEPIPDTPVQENKEYIEPENRSL